MTMMQAVILAGGLGTRLRPLTETIPKPMMSIKGRPFLEYELLLLKSHGIHDYVLCVGYLGEKIEEYFGDGSNFGVTIRYSHDTLAGPAGALKRAEDLLEDIFFVTYGDAYLRLDYEQVMEYFTEKKELGLMTVYENRNNYGKSDLVVRDGYVVRYDKKKNNEAMNWINFGVSLLRKKALELIPKDRSFVDEEEFYGNLIERKELLAYEVRERFYEIGNPASLQEFEKFVSQEEKGGQQSDPALPSKMPQCSPASLSPSPSSG